MKRLQDNPYQDYLEDEKIEEPKLLPDNYIGQYIPSYYKENFSATNVVSVFSSIIEKAFNEMEVIGMNEWNNPKEMEREFMIDITMEMGVKVRSTEMLKSFFKFKGTRADLEYVTKILGFDADIHKDGSVVHIGVDGKEEFIQTSDYEGPERAEPCRISYVIILDVNSPSYEGYDSGIIDKINETLSQRIPNCAYSNISAVKIKMDDDFDTLEKLDEEMLTSTTSYLEDSMFKELYPPPIHYGDEGLHYGPNPFKRYGNNNIPYLDHLQERVEFYFRKIGDEEWTQEIL